jgi:hypothetical protein
LWGNTTRSNRIACPHLGQITTRALPLSVVTGAGIACSALCLSNRNWLRRRAKLRRVPTRNRPY